MNIIKGLLSCFLVMVLAFSFAACELEEDLDRDFRSKKNKTDTSEAESEQPSFNEVSDTVKELAAETEDSDLPDIGWDTDVITPPPSYQGFELTYRCERSGFLRGESIELTTTVTNMTGEDHFWTGSFGEYRAEAVLFIRLDGGETYYIEHNGFPMTDKFLHYVAEAGESREVTYVFDIPKDAPEGYYSIQLSYLDETQTVNGVIGIFESPNVDVRNMSGVLISNPPNGATIAPASGMVCESYYNEVTGEAYEADGMGAYYYFMSIESWKGDSFLPHISMVEGGDLSISAPNSLGTPGIYYVKVGDDFSKGESYVYPQDRFASIPAGEYYVVISSRYKYVSVDGKESRYTAYEDVFKLTVLENKEKSTAT